MGSRISKANQDAARAELGRLFPAGSNVTTMVVHVSRSGMMRSIVVLAPEQDYMGRGPAVRNVSGLVARALGWRLHSMGGVRVDGCGMDMAFHLVYTLGSVLHGDGYSLDKVTA